MWYITFIGSMKWFCRKIWIVKAEKKLYFVKKRNTL